MSKDRAMPPEAQLAILLQAGDLVREGQDLPRGTPSRARLAKLSHKGWMIVSKAAKEVGVDATTLTRAARDCPAIQVADA
nr:hypothetical protein [Thermoplasmata archaeon]NIS10406.1 hypothetical protein [Thermoplasmata archaeon]NIS18393.1 hypothetical protein [Thermoplasmata archaeon]NIT75376.1 hypothetical protein [Thermoplasmata archaeon]NIU47549.1 hypothetical protein [Thermoplasmata archaeon]